MGRIMDPPREEHDKLPMPLTDGEKRLIDLFDTTLQPEWEIYLQPHLNGLRPDFVLLHPHVGIAVFEVKDWNLSQYYSELEESDYWVLMTRDQSSRTFSLSAENPINKSCVTRKNSSTSITPASVPKQGLP